MRSQSNDILLPDRMFSLAAVATTSGVKRFNMPSWSLGPNLPQAFPGGPSGSSGKDENDGCVGDAVAMTQRRFRRSD